MGFFLLKEEELEEDSKPEKLASSISDFVHSASKTNLHSTKIVFISASLLVTCAITAFFIFKSSEQPGPVVVIPENNSIKEKIVEKKEKYEDKQIYTYLQNVDNESIKKEYNLVNEDYIVSNDSKKKILENNNANKIVDSEENLIKQERQSLAKIDDLIQSVIETQKKHNPTNNVEDNFADNSLNDKTYKRKVIESNEEQLKQNNNKKINSVNEIAKFIEFDGGFYRVNLGTFETHAEARSTLKQFYKDHEDNTDLSNMPYYIISVDNEVDVVNYKVLLGNFKSKDDAIKFAQSLLK